MIKRIFQATVAIAALASLAACGGPEDDFKEAINASYEDSKECYSLRRARTADDFPLKVERGMMSRDEMNPILVGLQKAEMITVDTRKNRYDVVDYIYLTDEGKKQNVWDDEDGFCIGKPQVEEITRFTYGEDGKNKNVAQIEFTWQLNDLPSWLDREDFADIKGMTSPEEGGAVAEKGSNGWKAMIVPRLFM